jgi:anti-sigma regulatory factor (Ser/Thr protein kinase)
VGTNALGLVHELLLYDSDNELLDTAVPFLRAGLDVGEAALLSCSTRTSALLDRELGDDPRVAYLDRGEIYTTPAAAITAYEEIIDNYVAAGSERIRLVAEAGFGHVRSRLVDWGRYEAVVNHAMLSYPVSVVCAYDTRTTPPQMLSAGPATHPYVAHGRTRRSNPFYVAPEAYLRRTATSTADPLEKTPPDVEICDLVDLDVLRRRLERALYRPAHDPEVADDFILAIHEVATNASRHGRPPVDLRVWVTPTRLLCTVTDQGEGFDDPLVGYARPGSPRDEVTGGMGLWLARRYCDQVDLAHEPGGFTVRLSTGLGPSTEHPRRHRHTG